jgi:HicA toxin of bacterial toxin-antitoxin,
MLSTKNGRTLADVFARPVRADIRWDQVETLLRALGAEVTQGNGSRVRIALNERRMVFHTPHPQPTLVKDAVRSLRRFLIEAGYSP